MSEAHFVTVEGGVVTGSGYTPDGTLPENAIVCTSSEAQSVGPWSAVVDGVLIVGSPPMPAPAPLRTYKTDVWRRCTETEAETLDAALNTAPVKLRRLWADSTILEHESAEFSDLLAPMIAAFGAERAAEILAPSV